MKIVFFLRIVERKLKRKEVDNWGTATTASPISRNWQLSVIENEVKTLFISVSLVKN